MRMMQVAVNDVVDVISMGHRNVSAVLAVDMSHWVSPAIMLRCAGRWVRRGHWQ